MDLEKAEIIRDMTDANFRFRLPVPGWERKRFSTWAESVHVVTDIGGEGSYCYATLTGEMFDACADPIFFEVDVWDESVKFSTGEYEFIELDRYGTQTIESLLDLAQEVNDDWVSRSDTARLSEFHVKRSAVAKLRAQPKEIILRQVTSDDDEDRIGHQLAVFLPKEKRYHFEALERQKEVAVDVAPKYLVDNCAPLNSTDSAAFVTQLHGLGYKNIEICEEKFQKMIDTNT